MRSREKEPRKKVSHGWAIHRRREKVIQRNSNISSLNRQIIERTEIRLRLAEIDRLLSSDSLAMSAMKLQEKARVRAKLEVEQFWLQVKAGIISPDTQSVLLADKFDDLQTRLPDVYTWLVTPGEDGLSEAQRIRKNIMPPSPRIAGHFTKK